MTTDEFDKAVVAAVFTQAGLVGWRDTSLVEAARDAGLDLPRLRARFPGRGAVLLRFGVLADQAALAAIPAAGTPRERLFDAVMARFDQLQAHRPGVLALLEYLRTDPGAALTLYAATLRSMKWMLDAAGVPTAGLTGQLRVHGMLAAWTYALRAWERDDGADLPATMAALDRALDRAMQAEASLPFRRAAPDDVSDGMAAAATLPPDPFSDEPPFDEPPFPETTPPPPPLSGSDVARGPDGPSLL